MLDIVEPAPPVIVLCKMQARSDPSRLCKETRNDSKVFASLDSNAALCLSVNALSSALPARQHTAATETREITGKNVFVGLE